MMSEGDDHGFVMSFLLLLHENLLVIITLTGFIPALPMLNSPSSITLAPLLTDPEVVIRESNCNLADDAFGEVAEVEGSRGATITEIRGKVRWILSWIMSN